MGPGRGVVAALLRAVMESILLEGPADSLDVLQRHVRRAFGREHQTSFSRPKLDRRLSDVILDVARRAEWEHLPVQK